MEKLVTYDIRLHRLHVRQVCLHLLRSLWMTCSKYWLSPRAEPSNCFPGLHCFALNLQYATEKEHVQMANDFCHQKTSLCKYPQIAISSRELPSDGDSEFVDSGGPARPGTGNDGACQEVEAAISPAHLRGSHGRRAHRAAAPRSQTPLHLPGVQGFRSAEKKPTCFSDLWLRLFCVFLQLARNKALRRPPAHAAMVIELHP